VRLADALRGRLTLALASLRPSSGGRSARSVWLDIALVLVFTALLLQACAIVFGRLADRGTSPELAGAVLGLLLTTAFGALALFEVHLALTTLLLDSDLELLRAAPITAGELLCLKLLDAAPPTAALYLVFAVPAMAAFGVCYPLPVWAWIATPAILLALWLVPLGTGMALSLILLRVVPPRIVRRTLGLASTLTVAVMLIANVLVLPRLMESGEKFALSLSALATRMDAIAPALPPMWAAQALAGAATIAAGQASEPATATMGVLLRLLLLAAAAMASIGLLAATARTALEPVLGRLVSVSGRGTTRGDALARLGRGRNARPLAALVRRDVRLFVRDWPLLGDVVLAAVLWPLAALLLPQAEGAPLPVARALVIMLAGGMGMEIGSRSVPIERRAALWNRLTAVPPGRWAFGKGLTAAALGLPLLAIAVLVIVRFLDLAWADGLVLVAAAGSAFVVSAALGVRLGASFGDPEWRHPRAMLRLSGRLLATLLVVIQAAVWLVGFGLMDSGLGSRHPLTLLGPGALAFSIAWLVLTSAGRRFAQLDANH